MGLHVRNADGSTAATGAPSKLRVIVDEPSKVNVLDVGTKRVIEISYEGGNHVEVEIDPEDNLEESASPQAAPAEKVDDDGAEGA